MSLESIPKINNPEFFDKIIVELQDILSYRLDWLTHSLGRSQKLTKLKDGREYNYPGIHIEGSSYEDLLPGTNLGNYSFFQLEDPTTIKVFPNSSTQGSTKASIIFWFNIEEVLDQTGYRNTEEVKADIIGVLSKNLRLTTGRFTLEKVYEEPSNIYKGHSIKQVDKQHLMQPYAGFRFEGTLLYIDNYCGDTSDPLTVIGDTASLSINTPLSVDVLANDDGGGSELRLLAISQPLQGATAEIVDGEVLITPETDWTGVSYLTYRVTNGYFTETGILAFTVATAAPYGIQYQSALSGWSGQNVSYRTGDEGWLLANGHFDDYILPNPAVIQVLDIEAADPFRTLKYDNVFGNKNRFTDFEGLQNYPKYSASDVRDVAVVIDHLYGFALLTHIDEISISYGMNFTEAVAYGAGTFSGYTGFNVMPFKELNRIADQGGGVLQLFDREPFNVNFGGGVILSSTVYLSNTNNSLGMVGGNGNTFSSSGFDIDRLYWWSKNIQQTLQP